jgi:bacterioferritin
MKGSKKVLALLQKAIESEQLAIRQYEVHARVQKSQGFSKIKKRLTAEHLHDEYKHLKKLMDRLLQLGGTPDTSKATEQNIGTGLPEQFENDLAAEYSTIEQYRDAMTTCLEEKDHQTYRILEHILTDEEEHADDLETQLSLINKSGIENYSARNAHVEAK